MGCRTFMNRNLIVAVVILLLIVAGSFLLGKKSNKPQSLTVGTETSAGPTEPGKIGFIGPLTGDAAVYGISIQKAVELAKKEEKSNLQVIYEDSKCEPKAAVSAIKKLISVDHVAAIIGEICSGATLAIAPIAEKNKVVLISAGSTSPKITDAGGYIFRVIPSDALQGKFGADLVKEKGYKNLAIIYSNEDYGVGFSKVVKDSFENTGGSVVAFEPVEKEATDVRGQLTKVNAAKPDAIFLISNSPTTAVSLLKQIQELGIKAALFGSEAFKSTDIIKEAGSASEGLTVISVTAGTPEFLKMYIDAVGRDPGPFAAQGYDAFTALNDVIKKGATTGTEIKNALHKLSFKGVTRNIKFDSNGDVSGNYDVYVVKGGQFVLEKQ